MRYCRRVGLLAYPPSVLQRELELNVPQFGSILLFIPAIAWVCARVGGGELSAEALQWGAY